MYKIEVLSFFISWMTTSQFYPNIVVIPSATRFKKSNIFSRPMQYPHHSKPLYEYKYYYTKKIIIIQSFLYNMHNQRMNKGLNVYLCFLVNVSYVDPMHLANHLQLN